MSTTKSEEVTQEPLKVCVHAAPSYCSFMSSIVGSRLFRRMFRKVSFSVLCIVLVIISAGWSHAESVFDITGGSAKTDSRDATIGYEFRVDAAIAINGLGVWDEDSDGLTVPLVVALWNSGGTLLESTTVSNSSSPEASANTDGRWLFEDVPQLTLNPGNYVAGYFRPGNSDEWRFDLGFTTIPEVAYVRGRELLGNSLQFPTSTHGFDRHFG